jgi:hypothetical protein
MNKEALTIEQKLRIIESTSHLAKSPIEIFAIAELTANYIIGNKPKRFGVEYSFQHYLDRYVEERKELNEKSKGQCDESPGRITLHKFLEDC